MQTQDAMLNLAEERVAAERERCASQCEIRATALENRAAQLKAAHQWQGADTAYLQAGILRSMAVEIRGGAR
jgi:hypothetical protein